MNKISSLLVSLLVIAKLEIIQIFIKELIEITMTHL